MKKIVTIFLLVVSFNIFAQESIKITQLNYAGIKLDVPISCNAKSEYELLNCDNTDIQWLYLNSEMLKTVPEQFLNQFANQSIVKKKIDFKLKSFNSELIGKKFTLKSENKTSYRIIVYGIVNKQPLLLNIGTEMDINKNTDLDDFLLKMISVE